MGVMEAVLVILGVIIFVGSFLIPAGKAKETEDVSTISEETIKDMVGKEVEEAKNQISDIVDETITYAMEKTERSMDRLTNEKMLAVNEYSDTVLEEINKNHKEVVFMYDMLNSKHENLKSTVNEAVKTASEVKQTVKDAEVTAKEAEEKAKEAEEKAKEAHRKALMEETLPVAEPEKKAEPEEVIDFKPITPPHVEIIYQPEEEIPQPPKKTTKKPRTVKTKSSSEMAVPEIEVTLNASAKTGGRNSNERILELHKAGKSNMAIAKELGLGIGEVKLVIDLFEGI